MRGLLKDFKERQVPGKEAPWRCPGTAVLPAGRRLQPCSLLSSSCAHPAARQGSPAISSRFSSSCSSVGGLGNT